ncbi:hypothetical protein F5146DRAFT_32345 [Armillaria mellea]|nr:hypothetical protein F5146DRAFT_32345 [Armillaria mellea]
MLQSEMLPAPRDAPDSSPRDPSPGLEAIDELIGLWRGWIEERGSAMNGFKRKDSRAHRPELASLRRAVGQAYDNSCKGPGSQEEKTGVLEWLESAWCGIVQAWSHGVREDTTACVLSNIGVFQYFLRSRKTQTAVLCAPTPSHIAIQPSRKRRSEENSSKDNELHQGEDEVKAGTTRKIRLGHLHLAFNAPHVNLLECLTRTWLLSQMKIIHSGLRQESRILHLVTILNQNWSHLLRQLPMVL